MIVVTGHHFISKYDNGVIVPPGLITIRKNIFKYYFNDHSEYLNKKVVPINQISQAIGVRFKSLAASVDIWYESGKPGGTFQGISFYLTNISWIICLVIE